jgi:Zn-dependent metalloprotease
MKKTLAVAMLLTATVAFGQNDVEERMLRVERTPVRGGAEFIKGRLGKLPAGRTSVAAQAFMEEKKQMLLRGVGDETFEPIGEITDDLGQTHVRLQQHVNGLKVVGAEFIVHADRDRNVFAMNGRFKPSRELPRDPAMSGWSAIQRAAEQAGIENASYTAWPELTYVVNERGNAFLAYAATASYVSAEGEEVDIVYADALTGDLVMRAPQVQRARNRATYNGNQTATLPGTLVLSETTGTTSDAVISTAHGHAATSYDYYSAVHARDSFNNAGAQIKTTVHHKVAYNNAFWNGTQLVYGDGDGTTFTPLGNALDVGAHELTHAVTTFSANLVYSNESGALNEATSDIMASAVEAWKKGVVNTGTWQVGEDIYTPGTAGDALRSMADPAASGDYDYYPTRYTGTADNGGVHSNSGIANLAFKMMVTGGTHPRAKTTVNVTALNATAMTSINMGAKIWYRALTVYMNSSTNFSGARTATVQAATDLYGAAAAATVNSAWDAVGVAGPPPPAATVTLSNGVALTSQSAATGAWKHYKIAVPAGQASLAIVMSGGTGDGDLYVKRGAQPTLTTYDYRPYLSGNAESVSVTSPVAGDWYISIYAYAAFSGVSIKATYAAPTCTSASASLSGTGVTSYQPNSSGYASSVSGTHTATLTGPSGTDFDLYLQKLSGTTWSDVKASEGATSSESVSYAGTAGTYRWRIYSYQGSGTYTICTTKP